MREPVTYYNEFDPYAAEWLRSLIREGLIMQGDVDERSICDVEATDLRGYTRCHFFAGIGIWDLALQYAGWPADRPVWTGSCPCQPFSAAGKGKGKADARHLWPEFHRLIDDCRPACVIGEQVPAAIGHGWLDDLCDDMAGSGYATESLDLPACSIGSPTIRQRLFWLSHASGTGPQGGSGHAEGEGEHAAVHGEPGGLCMPDGTRRNAGRFATEATRYGSAAEPTSGNGSVGLQHAASNGRRTEPVGRGIASGCGFIADECEWLYFADGKTRPAQSGLECLVDGVAFRLADGRTRATKAIRAKILKAIGNAIVPDVAAAFVWGWLDLNPQESHASFRV